MQILTVDVGTGTQDIFLYDSRVDLENGFKLVVPSPTMIVRRRIQEATRLGETLLLNGYIMGGGPCAWAAEDHVKAGHTVYATPEAARTFNDDLEMVRAAGIQVVSQDEAANLPDSVRSLELRDFDFEAISRSLSQFGVTLDQLAAVAIAVFDHGDAPPDVSDRQFRFDYLDERIREQNRLSAFAFKSEAIPPIMTRLQAVVDSAINTPSPVLEGVPLIVMDTAPAAVLGATYDPLVMACERKLIANVGNFHTLAFRLGPEGIEGVFEHHTGLIDLPILENLLQALAEGSLTHAQVFEDHGHGALVYGSESLDLEQGGFGVAVTGPRRNMMQASRLRPHFAVPFGDMMIAGCFGLLSAVADVLPELSPPIQASLAGAGGSGTPPWELD